ncbi:hypothetical protein O77CONTIG1_04834 [Leptolyngbya sp. O-77]|nr:hypothetical protein O77CONTIG1_04834 [Leptolyngbya sp. O-77]
MLFKHPQVHLAYFKADKSLKMQDNGYRSLIQGLEIESLTKPDSQTRLAICSEESSLLSAKPILIQFP